ncbi:MAG TPA: OmpA family protein [Sandaracinaceae bacterium LLY-WYZ-13_1]|nr:OmpA family protein [Sandaracinaceae bacterium LLY-WYZ-13_1]
MNTHALRALPFVALSLATAACGAGSASAGASMNSDGTVNADANASVDTPAGDLSASADSRGNASATASGGGRTVTTTRTAGGAAPRGAYAQAGPGTATSACHERWVHMPLLISFPTGGTTIDAQNRQILQEMVRTAQSRQDIRAVRVEGHTDTCGREVNNMRLSEQRAETVAMELVRMGVPRERIRTVGYGSRQPRANESCARRAADSLSRNTNRRVEFSLLVCR